MVSKDGPAGARVTPVPVSVRARGHTARSSGPSWVRGFCAPVGRSHSLRGRDCEPLRGSRHPLRERDRPPGGEIQNGQGVRPTRARCTAQRARHRGSELSVRLGKARTNRSCQLLVAPSNAQAGGSASSWSGCLQRRSREQSRPRKECARPTPTRSYEPADVERTAGTSPVEELEEGRAAGRPSISAATWEGMYTVSLASLGETARAGSEML